MNSPAETPCRVCEKPSIVTVNGVGGCADHIDEAMATLSDVLRTVREFAESGRASAVSWSAEYEEQRTESPLGAPPC